MSNYSRDQAYPPSNLPTQHNQYDLYGPQPTYSEHPLQRKSSFDAGDDAGLLDNGRRAGDGQSRGQEQGGVARGYTTYQAYNSLGSQNVQSSTPMNHGSLAHRPTAYGSSLSGYQHQTLSASSAATQPSYDPSRFPQSQVQHNPQSYGSPQPSYSSGGHQPYNPAAYQPSNIQRQPSLSYAQQSLYGSPGGYNATQAPPLSQRLGEPAYNTQATSFGSYPSQPSFQQQQYFPQYADASSQSTRATMYSPPAPPPPAHDTYPGNTYAPRPYSHNADYAAQSPIHEHSAQQSHASHVERQPSHASDVSNFSGAQSHSPQPSLPSPSFQPPSASANRSNTLNRHPQRRPLPGPPSESESDNDYFGGQNGGGARQIRGQDEAGYEDLMREVDAAIIRGRSSSGTGRISRPDHGYDQLFASDSPQLRLAPDEAPTHVNGNIASGGGTNINYGAFSDESDAEAAAGLAAMRAADEQEAAEEEARRRSGSASFLSGSGSQRQSRQRHSSVQDVSSDSDFPVVDMTLLSGDYQGGIHYGDDSPTPYAAAAAMAQPDQYSRLDPRMNSTRSSGRSSEGRESQFSGYESIPTQEEIHPFPSLNVARVDTSGTGGLTEPSPHPRRLSFEDGDEVALAEPYYGRASGSVSPSKDSIQELFFHPDVTRQRPLPPAPSASDPGNRIPNLIPAGTYANYNRTSQYEPSSKPYPSVSQDYQTVLLSPSAVPRSTSLSSTRSAPRLDQPSRAKTDADRAKLLKQQLGGRPGSDYESPVSQSAVTLDLPAIPRKKFNPSKLSIEQYRRCTEPWALSSIVAWIRDLAEDETDLRERSIAEGIVALFTQKVPTMNITEAETLGDRVVAEMFASGALIKEEEWVKFGSGTTSGVLFQLTGIGCYSNKVHNYPGMGRCYAHHCMRTVKKVNLSLPEESEMKSEDWATFYNLKPEDIASHPKKEIERQNVLHEIVTTEVIYMSHLEILRVLYRDSLARFQPPIIQSKRLPGFISEVFGNVDAVKKVNEDYLLAQLKYRQKERGPWIVGFSDIFREWIRKAKSVYIEYATGFPRANFLVRREAERNILFRQFLDQAREDKRSNRLSWDTYLKDPITRLQRYGLLLQTVHKSMQKESEEKMNLQFAIDEIRACTFECNAKVDEMQKKMDLIELGAMIKLRKGMEKEVELNLDHRGREVLIRGDLQRAGGKGFQWVDTHAILFDHYLVLAKTVVTRDSSGGRKSEVYDVSKMPIPMDLIMLESTNDDAVVKSTKLGAVTTTIAPRGTLNSDPRLGRTTSSQSSGGALTQTATSNSLSSKETIGSKGMVTATVLEPSSKEERIMYPFRLKHLGKTEVYTLYAPSAQNRQEWCEAIIEAKTRHAASLFAQNAEPFRLRVLADSAFGYEGVGISNRSILIKGTPLDRAIKETESQYRGQARPGPICRAAVNCATVFNQPYGRLMCAIGTDFGVFISEYHNPRGWFKAVQISHVTQIAVFEEFNLFLLISDKSLIAYHLDTVCPTSGTAVQNNDASTRRAPQKLSGAKDVGFFATGRMKDRALVFYKKKEGMSSTFKVLEPVLSKSNTTRSRFMPSSTRRGQTEFFREYDEFYIPAECYSINLFHSSLAISTSRGVEVLTLDKKQPWTVPSLRSEQLDAQEHLSSIADRIKDLKPLGMFRLGETEFLIVFEECAVYVNKHGDVSRGVVMEFVGRAKSACLYGQYLILFDDTFVEIRNAMNGRMKQVISGKDIKMLDDGGGENATGFNVSEGLGGGVNGLGLQGLGTSQRTVKFSMQHPGFEKSYLVVELIETTDRKE